MSDWLFGNRLLLYCSDKKSVIIYKTTNVINGKIYVGKLENERKKTYLGSGKLYSRAEKKYGKENFRRVTIDSDEDRNELCIKEIFWIDFYDARNSAVGYNIQPGGEGSHLVGEKHPMFGKHQSEESKRKNSESHKGKTPWNKGIKTGPSSKETKQKQSIALKGRKQSAESIKKRTESRKEYSHSEETRLKISKSVSKLWQLRHISQLQAGG